MIWRNTKTGERLVPAVEYERLRAENERLRAVLDRIEAEPEDPLKVQQIARRALTGEGGR